MGGTGRSSVARRPSGGISVGPGRTNGCLGDASRVGTVPQLDPRERAGTGESVRPYLGVLARRLSRYVLGSQEAAPSGGDISIWAVPTLGGQPKPYLEGVAEFDWTQDGSRLTYHTPGPGDPLFVSDGDRRSEGGPFLPRLPGSTVTFHCGRRTGHSFISSRVPSQTNWTSGVSDQDGGTPERITSHNGRVSHPVLLDGGR